MHQFGFCLSYNWRRDEDATPHATDDVSSVIYSVRQRRRRVSDVEFGHLMTVIKPRLGLLQH